MTCISQVVKIVFEPGCWYDYFSFLVVSFLKSQGRLRVVKIPWKRVGERVSDLWLEGHLV